MRVGMVAAACLALGLAVGAAGDAGDPASGWRTAARTVDGREAAPRMREGDRLHDQRGTFAVTGERVTFQLAESGQSLRVLENLALERVMQVLEETRRSDQWVVTGTITEYRGSNYLLLTRAVVASAPAARQ